LAETPWAAGRFCELEKIIPTSLLSLCVTPRVAKPDSLTGLGATSVSPAQAADMAQVNNSDRLQGLPQKGSSLAKVRIRFHGFIRNGVIRFRAEQAAHKPPGFAHWPVFLGVLTSPKNHKHGIVVSKRSQSVR
jgi:hypothetical protein